MAVKGKPVEGSSNNSMEVAEAPKWSMKERFVLITREDGTPVGYVQGDVFIKTVQKSRHMLRKPKAWASDIEILNKICKLGAKRIILHEEEDNFDWEASISAFWGKGSFGLNRGYGEQRGLILDKWNVRGEGVPLQLVLF